jgi:hypothetical protein
LPSPFPSLSIPTPLAEKSAIPYVQSPPLFALLSLPPPPLLPPLPSRGDLSPHFGPVPPPI